MITFLQGDLFNSDTEAIVNTVNCVGVMGRGIALQFKNRFPDNYKFYESACNRDAVVPGKMLVYETNSMFNPKYIINFPTKRHWRGNSKVEDIEKGLVNLVSVIKSKKIKSISIPPLGCGLGGLKWDDVRDIMKTALEDLNDVDITIFEPVGSPSAKEMVRNQKPPQMTIGRASLVCLMKRYLNGLMDPEVTLIEIHKLMFFLQESGEPLRLNYTKGYFGPYAENLSHVLKAIEGYFIYGYADGGDNPDKQIMIVPGADVDADAFIGKHAETKQRIDRVADLVDGFETPYGMELLATVFWTLKYETKEFADVVKNIYAWGTQKQKFTHRQIRIAYDRLVKKEWISEHIQ